MTCRRPRSNVAFAITSPAAPPAPSPLATFHWVGSDAMLLDTPTVETCGHVVIGRYGGHTVPLTTSKCRGNLRTGASIYSKRRSDTYPSHST